MRQHGQRRDGNGEQRRGDDGALSSPSLREHAKDDAAHDCSQREHDTDRPYRMRIEVMIALQEERVIILAAVAEGVKAGHEQNKEQEEWQIAAYALP